MTTVTAVLLGRERRLVSTFAARGATSPESARTLQELGVSDGLILHRLEKRAVVRRADGRYYLDEKSWEAVRRGRRRAVSVLGAIVLAVVLILLFGTRRAQAVVQGAGARPEIDSIFADLTAAGSPGCRRPFQGRQISGPTRDA